MELIHDEINDVRCYTCGKASAYICSRCRSLVLCEQCYNESSELMLLHTKQGCMAPELAPNIMTRFIGVCHPKWADNTYPIKQFPAIDPNWLLTDAYAFAISHFCPDNTSNRLQPQLMCGATLYRTVARTLYRTAPLQPYLRPNYDLLVGSLRYLGDNVGNISRIIAKGNNEAPFILIDEHVALVVGATYGISIALDRMVKYHSEGSCVEAYSIERATDFIAIVHEFHKELAQLESGSIREDVLQSRQRAGHDCRDADALCLRLASAPDWKYEAKPCIHNACLTQLIANNVLAGTLDDGCVTGNAALKSLAVCLRIAMFAMCGGMRIDVKDALDNSADAWCEMQSAVRASITLSVCNAICDGDTSHYSSAIVALIRHGCLASARYDDALSAIVYTPLLSVRNIKDINAECTMYSPEWHPSGITAGHAITGPATCGRWLVANALLSAPEKSLCTCAGLRVQNDYVVSRLLDEIPVAKEHAPNIVHDKLASIAETFPTLVTVSNMAGAMMSTWNASPLSAVIYRAAYLCDTLLHIAKLVQYVTMPRESYVCQQELRRDAIAALIADRAALRYLLDAAVRTSEVLYNDFGAAADNSLSAIVEHISDCACLVCTVASHDNQGNLTRFLRDGAGDRIVIDSVDNVNVGGLQLSTLLGPRFAIGHDSISFYILSILRCLTAVDFVRQARAKVTNKGIATPNGFIGWETYSDPVNFAMQTRSDAVDVTSETLEEIPSEMKHKMTRIQEETELAMLLPLWLDAAFCKEQSGGQVDSASMLEMCKRMRLDIGLMPQFKECKVNRSAAFGVFYCCNYAVNLLSGRNTLPAQVRSVQVRALERFIAAVALARCVTTSELQKETNIVKVADAIYTSHASILVDYQSKKHLRGLVVETLPPGSLCWTVDSEETATELRWSISRCTLLTTSISNVQNIMDTRKPKHPDYAPILTILEAAACKGQKYYGETVRALSIRQNKRMARVAGIRARSIQIPILPEAFVLASGMHREDNAVVEFASAEDIAIGRHVTLCIPPPTPMMETERDRDKGVVMLDNAAQYCQRRNAFSARLAIYGMQGDVDRSSDDALFIAKRLGTCWDRVQHIIPLHWLVEIVGLCMYGSARLRVSAEHYATTLSALMRTIPQVTTPAPLSRAQRFAKIAPIPVQSQLIVSDAEFKTIENVAAGPSPLARNNLVLLPYSTSELSEEQVATLCVLDPRFASGNRSALLVRQLRDANSDMSVALRDSPSVMLEALTITLLESPDPKHAIGLLFEASGVKRRGNDASSTVDLVSRVRSRVDLIPRQSILARWPNASDSYAFTHNSGSSYVAMSNENGVIKQLLASVTLPGESFGNSLLMPPPFVCESNGDVWSFSQYERCNWVMVAANRDTVNIACTLMPFERNATCLAHLVSPQEFYKIALGSATDDSHDDLPRSDAEALFAFSIYPWLSSRSQRTTDDMALELWAIDETAESKYLTKGTSRALAVSIAWFSKGEQMVASLFYDDGSAALVTIKSGASSQDQRLSSEPLAFRVLGCASSLHGLEHIAMWAIRCSGAAIILQNGSSYALAYHTGPMLRDIVGIDDMHPCMAWSWYNSPFALVPCDIEPDAVGRRSPGDDTVRRRAEIDTAIADRESMDSDAAQQRTTRMMQRAKTAKERKEEDETTNLVSTSLRTVRRLVSLAPDGLVVVGIHPSGMWLESGREPLFAPEGIQDCETSKLASANPFTTHFYAQIACAPALCSDAQCIHEYNKSASSWCRRAQLSAISSRASANTSMWVARTDRVVKTVESVTRAISDILTSRHTTCRNGTFGNFADPKDPIYGSGCCIVPSTSVTQLASAIRSLVNEHVDIPLEKDNVDCIHNMSIVEKTWSRIASVTNLIGQTCRAEVQPSSILQRSSPFWSNVPEPRNDNERLLEKRGMLASNRCTCPATHIALDWFIRNWVQNSIVPVTIEKVASALDALVAESLLTQSNCVYGGAIRDAAAELLSMQGGVAVSLSPNIPFIPLHLLVTELSTGFLCRTEQAAVADSLGIPSSFDAYNSIGDDILFANRTQARNRATQMLMGRGKTSFITPWIVACEILCASDKRRSQQRIRRINVVKADASENATATLRAPMDVSYSGRVTVVVPKSLVKQSARAVAAVASLLPHCPVAIGDELNAQGRQIPYVHSTLDKQFCNALRTMVTGVDEMRITGEMDGSKYVPSAQSYLDNNMYVWDSVAKEECMYGLSSRIKCESHVAVAPQRIAELPASSGRPSRQRKAVERYDPVIEPKAPKVPKIEEEKKRTTAIAVAKKTFVDIMNDMYAEDELESDAMPYIPIVVISDSEAQIAFLRACESDHIDTIESTDFAPPSRTAQFFDMWLDRALVVDEVDSLIDPLSCESNVKCGVSKQLSFIGEAISVIDQEIALLGSPIVFIVDGKNVPFKWPVQKIADELQMPAWLAAKYRGLVRYVWTNMRYRSEYGFDDSVDCKPLGLAIPYRKTNDPMVGSEFTDIELRVVTTFVAYYHRFISAESAKDAIPQTDATHLISMLSSCVDAAAHGNRDELHLESSIAALAARFPPEILRKESETLVYRSFFEALVSAIGDPTANSTAEVQNALYGLLRNGIAKGDGCVPFLALARACALFAIDTYITMTNEQYSIGMLELLSTRAMRYMFSGTVSSIIAPAAEKSDVGTAAQLLSGLVSIPVSGPDVSEFHELLLGPIREIKTNSDDQSQIAAVIGASGTKSYRMPMVFYTNDQLHARTNAFIGGEPWHSRRRPAVEASRQRDAKRRKTDKPMKDYGAAGRSALVHAPRIIVCAQSFTVNGLIRFVVQSGEYSALIDTAGFFRQRGAEWFARRFRDEFAEIPPMGFATPVPRDIYYVKDGQRLVMRRSMNHAMPSIISRYNNMMPVDTHFFMFYDEKSTIGVDFKQPQDMRGIVVVSPADATLTRVAQGAFRLRKLALGQSFDYALVNGRDETGCIALLKSSQGPEPVADTICYQCRGDTTMADINCVLAPEDLTAVGQLLFERLSANESARSGCAISRSAQQHAATAFRMTHELPMCFKQTIINDSAIAFDCARSRRNKNVDVVRRERISAAALQCLFPSSSPPGGDAQITLQIIQNLVPLARTLKREDVQDSLSGVYYPSVEFWKACSERIECARNMYVRASVCNNGFQQAEDVPGSTQKTSESETRAESQAEKEADVSRQSTEEPGDTRLTSAHVLEAKNFANGDVHDSDAIDTLILAYGKGVAGSALGSQVQRIGETGEPSLRRTYAIDYVSTWIDLVGLFVRRDKDDPDPATPPIVTLSIGATWIANTEYADAPLEYHAPEFQYVLVRRNAVERLAVGDTATVEKRNCSLDERFHAIVENYLGQGHKTGNGTRARLGAKLRANVVLLTLDDALCIHHCALRDIGENRPGIDGSGIDLSMLRTESKSLGGASSYNSAIRDAQSEARAESMLVDTGVSILPRSEMWILPASLALKDDLLGENPTAYIPPSLYVSETADVHELPNYVLAVPKLFAHMFMCNTTAREVADDLLLQKRIVHTDTAARQCRPYVANEKCVASLYKIMLDEQLISASDYKSLVSGLRVRAEEEHRRHNEHDTIAYTSNSISYF